MNHHFGEMGDIWKHLPLIEILRLNPPRHYWDNTQNHSPSNNQMNHSSDMDSRKHTSWTAVLSFSYLTLIGCVSPTEPTIAEVSEGEWPFNVQGWCAVICTSA